MVTHFSGKSARSLPQNPMQRPTALTVSQPDSGSFPFGSLFYVIHDWQESLSGFSSVISFSCLLCSPSIFLQLFHHLCLCPSLSPFFSQFTVSNMQFPLFHMLFAFVQSLQLFLPFLLHLCLLPIFLHFFLQKIIKSCGTYSHKLCLIRQPEMITDILF